MKRLAAALALWVMGGAGAQAAELCDFRLSEIIAARAPALAAEAVTQGSLGSLGGRDQDFFTLVDTSGITAIGALMGGADGMAAAGQAQAAVKALGIGGTFVTSPTIGAAAGLAALGALGLEGACRFQNEQIADYYEVLAVLSVIADTADPKLFQLQLGAARKKAAVVEIWDGESGVRRQYRVADLFFANGALMLNRLGPDRNLGYLAQFRGAEPAMDTPPLDAFKPTPKSQAQP